MFDWIQHFFPHLHKAEDMVFIFKDKSLQKQCFKTDYIYCTSELQFHNTVSPLSSCVRLLMHSLNFHWFLVVFTSFVLFVVAHSPCPNVQSYATSESTINMKSHVKRLDTCCMSWKQREKQLWVVGMCEYKVVGRFYSRPTSSVKLSGTQSIIRYGCSPIQEYQISTWKLDLQRPFFNPRCLK